MIYSVVNRSHVDSHIVSQFCSYYLLVKLQTLEVNASSGSTSVAVYQATMFLSTECCIFLDSTGLA